MKKLLLILTIIFLAGCGQSSESPVKHKNRFENLFQQGYPDNTLGNLPKPAKMYFDSEKNIFALSTKGERIPLNLTSKILEDVEYNRHEHSSIFFDKISNRIFFVEDERIKYYDLNEDKVITTKISVRPRQERDTYPRIPNSEDIAGAYGDYIVLIGKMDYAAESLFRTLNIHTGEELAIKSWTFQSEYRQMYRLLIEGRAYELVLDSSVDKSFPVLKKDGLYTRHVTSSEKYLNVTIKNIDETYDKLVKQMTGHPLDFLLSKQEDDTIEEDPTLLLEFETNFPEHVSSTSYQRTFKVRSLFLIDENRVAIEVDNSAIVVNLEDYTAEVVEGYKGVADLLSSAKLLAPPLDNNYDFAHEPYCDNLLRFYEESITDDDTYISCLE